MSDLFTVKLDISAITNDVSDRQVYILLVDKKKTKKIYDFKLWVRFLFSLEYFIELVYDDAVIHDLEDVQILSLLQIVRVLPVESVPEEHIRKKTLTPKLKKDNKIYGNTNHAETYGENSLGHSAAIPGDNSADIFNFLPGLDDDSSHTSENTDICKQYDTSELDAESENPNFITQDPSMNYNPVIEMNNGNENKIEDHFLGDVTFSHGKNEVYGQLYVDGDSTVEHKNFAPPASYSCNNVEIKVPVFHNNSDHLHSQRKMISQFNANAPCQSTLTPNTYTPQKKQFEKPFSMGHVLTFLRNKASFSGNGDGAVGSQINFNSHEHPFARGVEEPYGFRSEHGNFENSQVAKRKARKRVRKHKSKRKPLLKGKHTYEVVNPFHSLNTGRMLKRPSQKVKPKHVRFQEYDSEYGKDGVKYVKRSKKSGSESSNCNRSEVTSISDLQFLIDEKRKALSTQLINSSGKSDSQTRDKPRSDGMYNEDDSGYANANENEIENEVENENENTNANANEKEKEKKNENENGYFVKIEEGNPEDDRTRSDAGADILDALGNLRGHNGEPLVFQRPTKEN